MPKNSHVAFHLRHVHMRVAWADAAANDLEAGREHVDVAERAVGHAALNAEGGVHGRLHLSPKRAEARPVVHVLDDCDRRHGPRRHIVVPILARGDGSARRFFRPDHSCPREANDWRQLAVDDDRWLDREADGAPLRRDDLETVADRWRVPGLESFKILGRERIFGHCFS
jgi:hypothetical protein